MRLALSFGDQTVNSEGILLNLVRNVKAADDVLDITHVGVMMVMVFALVIMMIVSMFFMSMLVFVVMRMFMGVLM